MRHEAAWERLPDLLVDRDDHELLAHVNECHLCQARLFRLARVDRVLRRSGPDRDRRRLRMRVGAPVAGASAVAAAAAAFFVLLGRAGSEPPAQFTLRTAFGSVVARASVTHGDGENDSIALVAHGLPDRPADTYVLWTRAPDSGRPVLIGRFMVSHDGECRARFNLAGRRHSSHFWITPEGVPGAVVATT